MHDAQKRPEFIVIAYVDGGGATGFATVQNSPAAIKKMRTRLTAAGFSLL